MTPGLHIHNLHIHYGDLCALHRISLDIPAGKLVALLGRNGAGKSSLFKAVCGLVTPSEGSISWKGQPIEHGDSHIAYLPQKEAVDWNFPITVRGVIEMGRFPYTGWLGKFTKKDRDNVDRAIDQMDLSSVADRQVNALSGGQQQRMFIARALAQEAEVILLDEPFNGLDHPSQQTLSNVLKSIAEEGRVVLVAHHDLKTVETWFDEAILLNRHLVYQGSAESCLTEKNMQEAFSS